MIKKEMGKRIRLIRESLGKTQTDFADFIDVSLQTISRYERGEMFPPGEVLVKIVQKTSINPNWLLKGEGDMFITPHKPESILGKISLLLSGMSEEQKKDILKMIEKEKLLADLLDRDKNKGYC